jgi:hypothetical protein
MSLQLMWTLHTLPLWFLVFSLFLPRLALLVYWVETAMAPFHLSGWIPLVVAILVPRVLVLYLIYLDQGFSLWFLIHMVTALVVWGGSGSYHSRRKHRAG